MRLRRLRQRNRVSTNQLEEMYYLIIDMKENIAEELEERKKHEDEIEKKAKEKVKETFFAKKFTFGVLLLWAMLLGPLLDGAVALLIWKALS